MQPADIARVVAPGEPRLSPDGALLAFTLSSPDLVTNRSKSQIWIAATDGSSAPHPFSAGADRDGHPRWSPDGQFLAFTSHREESGSQLLIAPVAVGGEVRTLVTFAEEIEALEWSPDAKSIAFIARLRDEAQYAPTRDADRPARRIRHLGWKYDNAGWIVDRPKSLLVVATDGMSPYRVLLTGGHDVGGSLSWATDSASIVVAHAGHETADVDRVVDLWSVPLEGGQPSRLTDGTHAWSQPVVSANGDRVAAYRDEPLDPVRNSELMLLDPSSGTAVEIAPGLDRGRSHISPSGVQFDGGRIWFMIEDAGSTALYAAPSDPILTGERVISGVDVRAGKIAFTESLPTGPFRIVVRDATSGAERELGSYPLPFSTTAPQKLAATASDGTVIDAWFVPPADFDPSRTYPVLLNIHGGPYSQYGYSFFDEFQVQSAAGYGVVYCNPRGSSGYGEAWGRTIRGPKCAVDPGVGWGDVDASDVLSVLDAALEAHPYLDATRAGVLGGSYGGYLTSWLVTQTDRFAAACSERAVNNMVTMTHTSDIGWWFNSEYAGVTPMEDTDELLRMSPVT